MRMLRAVHEVARTGFRPGLECRLIIDGFACTHLSLLCWQIVFVSEKVYAEHRSDNLDQ